MTCWVHKMLFIYMSTELTIRHRNDNCCAFPWGHHFFCSQLYFISCSSLCWVEALGALYCDMTIVACWRGFKGITSDITIRHNFTANSLILCLLQPFLPSPLWCFLSLICDLKVKVSLLWACQVLLLRTSATTALCNLRLNGDKSYIQWVILCVIYKHVAVAQWWIVCLPSMHVAHHIKIIVCNLQISFENKMLFLDFGCWCV